MQIKFVEFTPYDRPEAGELHIVPANPRGSRFQLTLRALDTGLDYFRRGAEPIECIVIPADPTLDQMLAATVITERVAGRELPREVPLAYYADLLTHGHIPATDLPTEESIEGMFAHFRHAASDPLTDPDLAAKFLQGWQKLETVLRPALFDPSIDPFQQSLFANRHDFEVERAYLSQDRIIYERDVANGESWRIQLPGESGPLPALYLHDPQSMMFKRWARTDPEAPGAPGYRFLAVRWQQRDWWFTTNPADRHNIRTLAAALQQAEEKHNPAADANDVWYDGREFDHSLVRPPKGGTRLAIAQVLETLKIWGNVQTSPSFAKLPNLALSRDRRPGKRKHRTRWLAPTAAMVAILFAAAFWGITHFRQNSLPVVKSSHSAFSDSRMVENWREPSKLQSQPDGGPVWKGFEANGDEKIFELKVKDGTQEPLLIWWEADRDLTSAGIAFSAADKKK